MIFGWKIVENVENNIISYYKINGCDELSGRLWAGKLASSGIQLQ